VKRSSGSAADLATTLASCSYHQATSSSIVSSAATSVTETKYTPNLTTLWTNSDQLRHSLPFRK